MNILVIGLGSMGKRRIRLLKEMYPDYTIFGVDEREDRRKEVKELFDIECFMSIEEASLNDIDISFVCTSPLSHNRIISKCLGYKWNIFTELNLVTDGYKENIELAKKNGCTLFLSSTFFYRDEIRYINKKVTNDYKWNYVYHIGQYLPDWHPWEKYNDFFIGDKRTNGCREIMAIEFPWIVNTFGDVLDINVLSDKMTKLDISYQDNYMIQIKHRNGNKGMLIVDVVSPIAVRRFEAYAENKYIRWNGTPDALFEFFKEDDALKQVILNEKEEHMDGYQAFVVENAYKNEIREFFDVLFNNKTAQYDFEQDLKILKLIDSVEAW